MKRLVLYGAGGFGRETAYMVGVINYNFPGTYWMLGFLVDKEYYQPNQIVDGFPVLGTEEWILKNRDVKCVCTIADNKARERIQTNLTKQGIEFETLIAPYLPIPPSAKIGEGCVLGHLVSISVGTQIGDGVFLNTSVHIGHDAVIGNYSSIMPNSDISGNCHIGERVMVGGHAFVIPHRKIGDDARIAAGSIVFKDVKAGTTVIGNPAQRMRELES